MYYQDIYSRISVKFTANRAYPQFSRGFAHLKIGGTMNKKNLTALLIAALVLLCTVSASAATVEFGLDFEYTGGQEPAGNPPWLVADFQSTNNAPNQVRLMIDTFGLQEDEFVSSLYFNLDPELNAELLDFRFTSGTGLPAAVSLGNDSQNAAGELGQGFDIKLSWSTSEGRRFIADKFIIYTITYSDAENPDDTITASSFNFFNRGGLLSAAHVEGILPDDGAGWIAAVPIPGTIWLLASGVLGLAAIRKRFKV
jgi:hypothetical protein